VRAPRDVVVRQMIQIRADGVHERLPSRLAKLVRMSQTEDVPKLMQRNAMEIVSSRASAALLGAAIRIPLPHVVKEDVGLGEDAAAFTE